MYKRQVDALKSAVKSAIVKSVSWPTAEITGISDANIALATFSSLKAHKSSILPVSYTHLDVYKRQVIIELRFLRDLKVCPR